MDWERASMNFKLIVYRYTIKVTNLLFKLSIASLIIVVFTLIFNSDSISLSDSTLLPLPICLIVGGITYYLSDEIAYGEKDQHIIASLFANAYLKTLLSIASIMSPVLKIIYPQESIFALFGTSLVCSIILVNYVFLVLAVYYSNLKIVIKFLHSDFDSLEEAILIDKMRSRKQMLRVIEKYYKEGKISKEEYEIKKRNY